MNDHDDSALLEQLLTGGIGDDAAEARARLADPAFRERLERMRGLQSRLDHRGHDERQLLEQSLDRHDAPGEEELVRAIRALNAPPRQPKARGRGPRRLQIALLAAAALIGVVWFINQSPPPHPRNIDPGDTLGGNASSPLEPVVIDGYSHVTWQAIDGASYRVAVYDDTSEAGADEPFATFTFDEYEHDWRPQASVTSTWPARVRIEISARADGLTTSTEHAATRE